MNARTTRLVLRWVHIIGALLIGTALYSPLKSNQSFMTLVLFILVPVVAITGIAMWKQGKLMALLKPR
ncbi:hypothetical protein [Vibrio methylphosphonaticus]|uniref:hypothetical protein n=1 Tax=Vibrio methylphosphonaticus TaxID=2946866 RepID=UPI002029BD5F|nr:hypothetical protein [Vibrio methylphosphonaticus]MCL9773774.1 hypothetical protein [Vibrio methylphosphonaticus]